MISEHQLNQSAQSGEDDLYKLDQVDRSDQPTDIEDSAPVTNAEDTTVATSQATPPVDLLEARAKVVSTTDQFGEEAELCLLPEKTQDPFDVGDGGDDLDDLRDPGDLSKEFPTKEKEKPETLPPREEEDTSNGEFGVVVMAPKNPQEVINRCMVQCFGVRLLIANDIIAELSIKEGEGKEEDNLRAAIDNLASHAETAESGLEQASPKKEEEEATHQVAGSEETSPNATVQGGLAEEAPVSGTIVSNDSNVESNVKSDEEQNVEPEKLEGSVPTDAAVSSGSPLVSPTHKEASPNVKDEEKEREASLSPFHSKSLSFGKEMMIKPSLSPAVASLNGDESDLSPTHSERTSSNATTSSYLYTTDESLSPQKTVRPVPPLQRTSSSPTRESENKLTDCMLEERDSFHMSLMPSQAQPISPEGSVEVEPSPDAKSRKKVKRIGSMPGKIRSSIGSVKRTFTTKKEAKKRSSSTLTRTNTVDDEAINNVSVLKPLTTQEWDPTCLLEELYSDYKQGLATAANPSGESARHYGYLDKLPTNRTKANLTTKWKRRYFRAQEGNIYYYQDRRAEKALGFIHLQSSRVVPIPEKLQIQIIPKDGKSIMLKAPDMDEFQAWHRALLLEATHPTLIAPSSPKPALENPIIVIDVGACSVRAGLVRDDPYPEIFFPAVCSFDAETFDLIECGLPALLPDNRYKAHQVYPRKVSLRMDRKRSEVNLPLKAMDAIVSTIMMQLDIDPQVAQLIMTLPPTVPEQERDELVELLLGTFGFAGICLQDQTQLALFSYNTTTGIIVDIGNHITVIPYIDGYAIEAGITRLPFGGNAITENLAKLVTMKGMRYFSETEMFINRFIKESLCFISQNYEDDLAECDKDPKAFLRGVDVDRFQLPDHRKMVTLDSSLFKAPEGLFSPHLWGKDVLGLHEIVWKAIQACPIDQRRELSKNIFLSGGSSVIPGLKERLRKEVASMAPAGVAVEVHTRGSYHHAAYCGASVLASLGSFQNYLVSWDDWSTTGAEALRKWTGS